MNKILIALLIVNIFLSGCAKTEKDSEAKVLYAEAMKIHDQVMPRMDEMYKLEQQLKVLRDSLSTDTVANHTQLKQLNKGIAALEAAGKAMMDWMHNIQEVPGATEGTGGHHHDMHAAESKKEISPEVLLNSQKDQKAKIEAIKVQMEKSIEQANEIVEGFAL